MHIIVYNMWHISCDARLPFWHITAKDMPDRTMVKVRQSGYSRRVITVAA
jgi:hypothetical protein